MKLLLLCFVVIFAYIGPSFGKEAISGGYCLNNIHEACSSSSPVKLLEEKNKDLKICTSSFGGFPALADRTQSLIQKYIQASMKYLLMASHFNEWESERPGFHKYLSQLSDSAFNDAVKIIKHVTTRGGYLNNFTIPMPEDETYHELGELEAMSKALDIEKGLASRCLNLIHASTHGDVKIGQHTDGEFAHFLADQVSDNHAVRVKSLANHVNTLSQVVSHSLSKSGDPSFVLHIYDQQVLV